MWGECILYMPATESAKRMSDEYFYEQRQYEEKVRLEREVKGEMKNELLYNVRDKDISSNYIISSSNYNIEYVCCMA